MLLRFKIQIGAVTRVTVVGVVVEVSEISTLTWWSNFCNDFSPPRNFGHCDWPVSDKRRRASLKISKKTGMSISN